MYSYQLELNLAQYRYTSRSSTTSQKRYQPSADQLMLHDVTAGVTPVAADPRSGADQSSPTYARVMALYSSPEIVIL